MHSQRMTNFSNLYRVGFLLLVGLISLLTSPPHSLSKPRVDTIYKQCACLCQAPGDIIGVITDFSNTGSYSCGTYNGKTCNYYDPTTGGVRSGTTKYCGGYKPGGTLNFRTPSSGLKAPIVRRGLEGAESTPDLDVEINIPSDEPSSDTSQERPVPR
ncbi:MAG: hypothetical protein R3B83_03290 [Nitrospirales bacterium]|nr:hypothetical protein [Nitrospira sp.]MDR4486538.1 hypothetical protein [Nitrospirales bacterium]